jgi:hypothetical protein
MECDYCAGFVSGRIDYSEPRRAARSMACDRIARRNNWPALIAAARTNKKARNQWLRAFCLKKILRLHARRLLPLRLGVDAD